MASKFQKEIIERLTRLEVMMSNHLSHHEATEKKFYRMYLPFLILGINIGVGILVWIIPKVLSLLLMVTLAT